MEGSKERGSRMVRQQPEFIYRETVGYLIMRPFRWFHYPPVLSFHKDINSPSWLVRVKLYEKPWGVLLKSAGVENIKELSLQPLQDQQLWIKVTSPWRLKDGTEGLPISFADVAHVPNY